MQIKYISFFIMITSVSVLTGCGELINKYLDDKFPLNLNNNGYKITVHSDIDPDINILIRGVYKSDKCERSRFNSSYTNVTYSELTNSINIENNKSDDISISKIPVNGGGWCDWILTEIKISPIPINKNSTSRTYISIPVIDNGHSKIKYSLTMAPVIYTSIKGPETLYSISKHEGKSISNRKDGDIYFNYKIDHDLATTISDKKIVIFPNGDTQKSNTGTYSNFITFEEIIKHSDKKEITSYSEYID